MRSFCRLSCSAILFVTTFPGLAAVPTAPPEALDSHQAYLELLDTSRESLFDEVLAVYDEHLSSRPDDVQAAVERCRFLEGAFYDEDEDYNPKAEESLDCVSDLETRHGNEPAVLELLLSQHWGEEAEDFYRDRIAPNEQEFTPILLARVHAHLSSVLQWSDETAAKSAEHAREAMSLDPTLNLFEVLASFEWEEGHRDRALEATTRSIELAETAWELTAPIDRLVEMKEFEVAREALTRQAGFDPESVDPAQQARVFAGVGDFDGARVAYDRAVAEKPWMEREIRKERFGFELDHGDAGSARAAYDALRDTGFDADPVLRNRLDLLRRFPGAAWSLRDVLGLLLILISVVGIVLLPAVLIVPLHYIALLRLRRPGAIAPRLTTWGLRHVWYLTAGHLFAVALGAFLFYPDTFIAWMNSDEFDIDIPDQALLSLGWLQTVAFALALAAIVRFKRFRALWRSGWTWPRTLGLVALWIFVGRLLAILSVAVANVSGTATYQERFLLSFGRAHGALALLLFVAVLIPVLEEFAFRGVLLDGLHRYYRFWIANVLQSIAFASIHENMKLVLVYFFLGMVAGEMRRRSQGLLVPIVFHAVNNLLAGAILVLRL